MPIYTYYFPQGWLKWFVGLFRRRQPDYSRYQVDLLSLHDDAWALIEEARLAFEAIALSTLPWELRKAAELSYHQIYHDGNVLILMYQYVKAMDEGRPEAIAMGVAMLESQVAARDNLTALKAHDTELRQLARRFE